MPKITVQADCGDAPEKELPRELVIDSNITQGCDLRRHHNRAGRSRRVMRYTRV